MPGHVPNLDAHALGRLRRLVLRMHRRNGRGVPLRDLVQMAESVRIDGGVTVDFEASRDLGGPMVVVRLPATPQPAACLDKLSTREREVAAKVAEGLTNKQIAEQLFISLATVKDHVHHILEKTGLAGRAAVIAAFRGSMPGGSESAGPASPAAAPQSIGAVRRRRPRRS